MALNSNLNEVRGKIPSPTKQVVFTYADSAQVGLHIAPNSQMLSVQKDNEWAYSVPEFLSGTTSQYYPLSAIGLRKEGNVYKLSLFSNGQWLCDFDSVE